MTNCICDEPARGVERAELQSIAARARKACEKRVRLDRNSDNYEFTSGFAKSIDDIECRQLFMMDATDLKTIEEAVKVSESKFRTVVENSPDGFFIAQNGKLKFANSKLLELTGFSFDEIKEEGYLDIIHPEDRFKLAEYHPKRPNEEKIPDRYNVRAFRKDGTELVVEINSSVVQWEGSPSTLVFVRDLTMQKKMEDKVRQRNKMESIGALSGGIAHDFNNLLSAIIGYAELAMEDIEQDTTLDRNLREIYKAGIRARELVKQILKFARQGDQETSTVQVREVADEALKLLRSSIPPNIEVRTNFQSDSLVKGDPTQIHQIFMNLCTNACLAMEEDGGTLEIELKDETLDEDTADLFENLSPGDYLKISFSDTGTGIPSGIVASIFEPYFTTRPPGEGSGMGLAIARGIVKKYGGEITVSSEEGEGAEFRIYLPVAKKGPNENIRQSEVFSGGNEKILLIDREPTVAGIQRKILERLGYKVTSRTNSLEALELFKSDPKGFDLVVADMSMPKMTGDRLAKKLMEIRPDIPVVLQTGNNNKMSRESAMKMGIATLAYKPMVKKELAETIRSALDGTNRT